MDLGRYSDNESRDRGDGLYCECGNRKPLPTRAACPRCEFLDGRFGTRSAIISALRSVSDLTLAELCDVAYGDHGEAAQSAMVHMLARMVKQGRVRRYLDEGAGEDRDTGVRSYRGHTIRIRFGARAMYRYRLTEPGRFA